jgi:uncharacterized protein (DUF885 family)
VAATRQREWPDQRSVVAQRALDVAIGMHTRGMSLAECERMFREQGLQSPGSARQQAARGTYDPAYLNYTLGKLMIRKLRADWAATRGGEKAWKTFHDEFLSFGGPPIPLVRRADAPGRTPARLSDGERAIALIF